MKAQVILTFLLVALSSSLSLAQQESPRCKSPIEYGNQNQVDPKHSSVAGISGRVVAESGTPPKQFGPVAACLGLFTEEDHRLIASVIADEEGRFRFDFVPSGRYRLVVRDSQNVFCLANMPLRVVKGPHRRARPLVIHMRAAGIDDCSYGDFK